jgi:hypothetical protein
MQEGQGPTYGNSIEPTSLLATKSFEKFFSTAHLLSNNSVILCSTAVTT